MWFVGVEMPAIQIRKLKERDVLGSRKNETDDEGTCFPSPLRNVTRAHISVFKTYHRKTNNFHGLMVSFHILLEWTPTRV